MYSIFLSLRLPWEDWVGREAPNLRILAVHSLRLCQRSASSRSVRVDFLKQFVEKLLQESGPLLEQDEIFVESTT